MGYYTDYNIEVEVDDPTLLVRIKQELINLSGYTAGWRLENGELHLHDAKWYDNQEDMQKLSELFPDLKFEMTCKGEDGEQWMIYAFGGKTEHCPGQVVFAKQTLW